MHEAVRVSDERRVAVKLLVTPSAVGSEVTARLRLECELLKKVAHPNMVEVLDVGTSLDGAPFVVMELLSGETLTDRIARSERLAPIEALRIAIRVASALSAAHRQGIVHSALRPREIFLSRAEHDTDVVKLLGFGLGRLSGASRVALRLELAGAAYSAPEQLDPRCRVDHRADQFALATITYEMLTGVSPFMSDSAALVAARIRTETPPPVSTVKSGIPDVVDAVLARAMEKDPLDRYPNMSALGQALENAAAAATVGPKSRRQTPSSVPNAIYRVRPDDPARASTEPGTRELAELRQQHDLPASERTPVMRARGLANDLRQALAAGDLDMAVARGEDLFEHALAHTGDGDVLDVLRTNFHLLDNSFAARLGDLDRSVSVRGDSPDLAPAARALLEAARTGASLRELVDRSSIPRRDTIRLLAGLMRRGLIATH